MIAVRFADGSRFGSVPFFIAIVHRDNKVLVTERTVRYRYNGTVGTGTSTASTNTIISAPFSEGQR